MYVLQTITALLGCLLQCTTIYGAPVEGSLIKRVAYNSTASCTIHQFSDVAKIKQRCSTIIIGDLMVPAGKTLDLTNLATSTSVIFSGVVRFGYKEWLGPLISVSGTRITITGTSAHVLDGRGAAWWDSHGGNGGKKKPKFFSAHNMINSTISKLNILNTPVHCFSIGGSRGLLVDSVRIDNKAGDLLAKNTDAFDVGSSCDITINNATVYNQDDCLAVNSGTNIHFTNGYCSGGHGISIGSVGGRTDNNVKGVYVSRSKIVNSSNGVRIKTVHGATGRVSDINYSDITLEQITRYGIVIQQDYLNGSPTGIPTSGVPITNVTLSNIHGTMAHGGASKYIVCASCSQFRFSNVTLTGGDQYRQCKGLPYGITC